MGDAGTSRLVDRRVGHRHEDRGFTLVELLIVLTIMPLIVGAIALGLIMVFSLQGSVSGRISDAGDAQIVSSTFLKDVQSAARVTEQSNLACGTGIFASTPTQLLGLEWGKNGNSYLTTVSYYTIQNAGASTYSLVRQVCTNGVTSTATQSSIVASDLSANGASTLPTIQCNAVNPPDLKCAPLFYGSNWMDAGDIQYILLSVQEHALLPKPNSTTPFYLTLSASPRVHVEASTVVTGNLSAPLTVLGTSCVTPSLTISNNVTVSIDVGGSKGNGTIGLGAKCKSVEVDNGGALNAGSVLTTNQNLNSVYYSPGGGVYPVPEFYTPVITDPYSALPPPSTAQPVGMQAGKCTASGNSWDCTAGYYSQDPGVQYFGNASNQTITFDPTGCTPDAYQGLGACRFLFEQGLTLPGHSIDNFGTGVYVYMANGSGVSFTGSPGVNINGNLNGSSQVLFFIASGAATFSPGISINLAGFPQMQNVTIWDAETTSPLTLGNNSNGGSITGFGGVYVPNEAVNIAPDQGGTMTVSFLVAQSLIFKNNLTVDIVH